MIPMTVSLSEFLISESFKSPNVVLGLISVLLILIACLFISIFIRLNRTKKVNMANTNTAAKPPIFSSALVGGASSLSAHSLDDLLAIEESLMALRELYHRKLISPDIYVEESMKYSSKI